MKRNKFGIIFLGITLLTTITCTGIILATGIQKAAKTASNLPQRQDYPEPHRLEKTELEGFSSFSLNLAYAEISILPSDGFYLEYCLDGACKEPQYSTSNNTFTFQEGGIQSRFQISLDFFPAYSSKEPFYLNLYIPKDQYFDFASLYSESGSTKITDLSAKKAEITSDYGNLNLESFQGDSLAISSDSGNVTLGTAECGTFQADLAYGDLKAGSLSASKQAQLTLESGNLDVSELAAEEFSLINNYGNCAIQTFQAKKCDMELESGNLKLRDTDVEEADIRILYGNADLALSHPFSEYNFDLTAEYGTVTLDRKKIPADEDGNTIYTHKNQTNRRNLRIYNESGFIELFPPAP